MVPITPIDANLGGHRSVFLGSVFYAAGGFVLFLVTQGPTPRSFEPVPRGIFGHFVSDLLAGCPWVVFCFDFSVASARAGARA